MKRLVVLFLTVILLCGNSLAYDDAENEGRFATVTATLLNGRMTPSRKGAKTAFFDKGDVIELTGRWSDDHEWVEVIAGEAGNCWVSKEYITEEEESYTVYNRDYNKIKIRKKPSDKGKVVGYLKKNKKVEITQVLLGWGKCHLGWIDLYYVEKEAD